MSNQTMIAGKDTVSISHARRLRSNLTPQEAKLWVKLRALRPIGLHFRRQVPLEGYVVDFACFKHRLIIEIDGSQHAVGNGVARDMMRDQRLAEIGFKTVRFWNVEVDASIDAVIDRILIEIDPGLVADLNAV